MFVACPVSETAFKLPWSLLLPGGQHHVRAHPSTDVVNLSNWVYMMFKISCTCHIKVHTCHQAALTMTVHNHQCQPYAACKANLLCTAGEKQCLLANIAVEVGRSRYQNSGA